MIVCSGARDFVVQVVQMFRSSNCTQRSTVTLGKRYLRNLKTDLYFTKKTMSLHGNYVLSSVATKGWKSGNET